MYLYGVVVEAIYFTHQVPILIPFLRNAEAFQPFAVNDAPPIHESITRVRD